MFLAEGKKDCNSESEITADNVWTNYLLFLIDLSTQSTDWQHKIYLSQKIALFRQLSFIKYSEEKENYTNFQIYINIGDK